MNMHECYLLACRTNTEYTNQNKNKLPKKGDNHKHKTVQQMENKISDNIIHHFKKTIQCTVKSVLRGNLWDKENVSL